MYQCKIRKLIRCMSYSCLFKSVRVNEMFHVKWSLDNSKQHEFNKWTAVRPLCIQHLNTSKLSFFSILIQLVDWTVSNWSFPYWIWFGAEVCRMCNYCRMTIYIYIYIYIGYCKVGGCIFSKEAKLDRIVMKAKYF